MTVDPAASDVRARAEELVARREPFVEARVVRAERPTSAKAGATAIVQSDGTIVGFVGGECAEASVQAQALAVLASREPVLLRITPEAGAGAVPEPAEPGAVVVHNPCLSGGTLEIFLEPVVPATLVVVHGDAPIARAVAAMAERLGYAVGAAAVSADGSAAIPPDADAVVVASHGHDEGPVLRAALDDAVPYIGLVASRRRGERVLDALDLTPEERARVRTPAGIDIGARTPEEVGLSILAEIVSIRPRHEHTRDAAPAPGGTAPVAVDPVCGMSVAAVERNRHLDFGGVTYWFCGPGCADAFAADPGSYVAIS
ncbi:MAG TPA: XdhC family protein [Acidimicrobiia bacterium]|nr:XdhC family protein [Acidimicrobiia bacterium]